MAAPSSSTIQRSSTRSGSSNRHQWRICSSFAGSLGSRSVWNRAVHGTSSSVAGRKVRPLPRRAARARVVSVGTRSSLGRPMGVSASLDTFGMAHPVFLDVDNTLLDNDAAKAALGSRIAAAVPADAARRFWELYETVRDAEDYVDFPATLARLASERPLDAAHLHRILDAFDYREFVYPGTL